VSATKVWSSPTLLTMHPEPPHVPARAAAFAAPRRFRLRALGFLALFAVALAAAAPAQASPAPFGLHVKGARLLDGRGHAVHLHGVNRSGSEYACIQDHGMFDGPNGPNSVAAMARWHVNAVRLMLNEDCWLGINNSPPKYSGAIYRKAIVNYVKLLHRDGMYAELSLAWGAPGTNQATYQSGGPDEDHAPAAWASLAQTFRNDSRVILAPWGETVQDANCFLKGGVCGATFGPANTPYPTAGMQQAVTVMRGAGYKGVISIPGVDYANDLSHWLSYMPKDPLHQLIAEAHVYGKQVCASTDCLDKTYAPVARKVPLIFGETGESFDDSDCGSDKVAGLLKWADAHSVGYEAWAWDTWNTCGSLISNYNGAPRGAYGSFIKAHYLQLK
jgi:Cellulase (glycosyl hydrolase family 5)